MLEMALEANAVVEILSTKEIDNLDESIKQIIVSKEVMEKLSNNKSPQGVIAICKEIKEKEITSNKILYLDDISDPGNLGTILRTALAFNYLDIILSDKTCSIYNDKALQSSQGAIFKLNILKNIDINSIKEKGYKIYATEIKGSVSLKEINKNEKHVLVLGNEAHGVSKEILDLSDKRIRIDINSIESLNVAIAGAIAMYELNK